MLYLVVLVRRLERRLAVVVAVMRSARLCE
jgi:hypothetical protein